MAVAVTLLVLAGWSFDLDPLKRVLPGFVAMNPATAVAFLLYGLALLLAAGPPSPARRAGIATATTLAATIGALKLAGLAIGWETGIDQLLFPDGLEATRGVGGPNRMPPNTALSLILLGAALALHLRPERDRWLRTGLALAAALLALLALLGYLYEVERFSGIAQFVPMALHTAALFLLLSFGTLWLTPTDPLPGILLSDRSGGVLARRFLPAALLFPIVFGYVRLLGQQLGLYESEFGLTLFVVVIILLFTALSWAYAVALDRASVEQERAEREARAAADRLSELERLKQVNEFKTTLLNTASHELNTPLTPLKLQIHLLQSSQAGGLNERQRRAVEILDRNVSRLSLLVQDVLDVARLQSGNLPLHLKAVDLNRVVREAAEAFEAQAAAKEVHLETRADGELRMEAADAQRLAQVAFNLIGNALKFTPKGGTVTVETAAAGPDAILRVRDTGAGLDGAQIARLFQPFSQVHDTMNETRAGAGLGLYICKGIITQHGGQMSVESPGPGKGSIFIATIPLRAEPTAQAPSAAAGA